MKESKATGRFLLFASCITIQADPKYKQRCTNYISNPK